MSEYDASRRYLRVPAQLPARISTIDPEQDPWTGRSFFRATQERCANVSQGGAYVRTAEPLAPGRRLLIEIHLPDGRRLEAIGRVAWSKTVMSPHEHDDEGGIGVEFLGGAASHLTALEDYIANRAHAKTASEGDA
ncbi:MAG: PilZ domain-containing protein [Myxococcales bacterium]|nr:PilZ domain-containing protein [Myxococcales bacterium]